jgi:hypothetical protein
MFLSTLHGRTHTMAKNSEVLEWLGLTPADMLVYLSIGAIGVMFFVHDATVDLVLAVAGVGLGLAACPLGMTRDPDVSGFTNAIKRVSYPLYVVLALAAIAVHYVWFNK